LKKRKKGKRKKRRRGEQTKHGLAIIIHRQHARPLLILHIIRAAPFA
jgi:hypothetical protein